MTSFCPTAFTRSYEANSGSDGIASLSRLALQLPGELQLQSPDLMAPGDILMMGEQAG